MQVTETKNEGLKREYQVKLEASLIESKTEERLRSMAGQMKMSGFRPGHVPLKLLKQRFGKEVTGEILEKVINETSGEVVSNNNLRPALPPKIEITSYNEGSDLEYKMELEVLPQLPEFDFEKVALVKPVCEVEPAEIEKAIERFAANSKDYARAEAGAVAKNGDKLTIDFLGRIDGVAFDGGASKGFGLVLGSGSFIAGFEDQLVGSKEGDKITVKVNFPENYHKADQQGKPAEFEVDVHEVLNAAPQEINDELAQKFGFEDLAAIRKAIEDQFSNDYQSYAKNKMKKELFDLLDKEYN
ncbi:MAG: trigger factor, partial [Pseudomonadota bacterium]